MSADLINLAEWGRLRTSGSGNARLRLGLTAHPNAVALEVDDIELWLSPEEAQGIAHDHQRLSALARNPGGRER